MLMVYDGSAALRIDPAKGAELAFQDRAGFGPMSAA
jgi:hypothetical protein